MQTPAMRSGSQEGWVVLAAVLTLCVSANALPYSSSSPVVQLDSSNLKAKIKSAGVALVEFYAPWCGHCKMLTPEYEKLAKAMKGSVMIAAVDADAHKDLAQEYGIKGFPTIKLLYVDGDKIKTADYQGQRQAKDMVTWVFEKAKNLAMKRLGEKASAGGGSKSGGSKPSGGGGGGADSGFYGGTDVVTLTDSSFADEVTNSNGLWMVEFYAPWCGHCKNLKPAWIEAASDLKGKVSLGAVDCTVHQAVCQEFGVQGYPTIKFFGQRKSSPEDYNGPREAPSIVSFAAEKWSRLAPPPEVLELTSQSVWDQACAGEDGKGGATLCLLAFLPDILDSKASGRQHYIKMLKKVAEAHKDRPYAYLWTQGWAQPELEAAVGVGGFGYPALVALKPKDSRYAVMRSAFEESHIMDFLEGLKHGRYPVMAVDGAMPSIANITPWDGKDAEVELEDEFSLDDLKEL